MAKMAMACVVLMVSALGACASPDADDRSTAELEVGVAKAAMRVGPTWRGDSSGCISAPADDTIRTYGGPDHIGDEYRSHAPDNPNAGHPGCDGAYIVDFIMPELGTNGVDGWNWGYLHAAHQGEVCGGDLWHNQTFYVYGVSSTGEYYERQHGDHFSWRWEDESGCNTQFVDGLPPVIVVQQRYTRVRMVTQMGVGDSVGLSKMVYFQTSDGVLPDEAPGGLRADSAE